MRCLVACEFSGTVRRAFAAKGHDCWSCDLLPSEDNSPKHIIGDVEDVLRWGWDMAIVHLPCTLFANSGVRWLFEGGKSPYPGAALTPENRNEERWTLMREHEARWHRCQAMPIARMAFENPIPHGHVDLGAWPRQIVQPWHFGHGETKATCWWRKGLPALVPSHIVDGREQRVHLLPPGPDRWKERSRTLPGVALAIAAQWPLTEELNSEAFSPRQIAAE